MTTAEYARLADGLAADIAGGRLKPGDRLPPQRSFAYERGIAVSTASRVYAELLRRGLAVGEVGRGTFIAGPPPAATPALGEPRDSAIDLEFNYPILPEQSEAMARSIADLCRPEALGIALKPATSRGTPAARELSAAFLARGGWAAQPEDMLFTGNGRQAIAACIAALVPVGGRLGVEAITYPQVKGLAARLGVTLVPLALDEGGLRPDAVERAHREGRLSALYLQSVLHNPLGTAMPPGRREEIARLADKLDLCIVDDGVYSFLADEPPLAALAPDRSIVLDSLSKRVAPGLALGFVTVPARLRERLMASIRAGGWTVSGFAFAAAQRLIADGTAAGIGRAKREDARRRQQIAAECLAGFDLEADERSYHLWLKLPERWRSEAFAAAAARRRIAITPSSAFAVSPGHAPNAVRIGLASPPVERLREALLALARLLRAGEEDFDVTE